MYQAPVEAIASALEHLTQARAIGEDTVAAVLAQAGRFAGSEAAPLAPAGDRQGARFANGAVAMPEGWAELYREWRENGWNGLSAPEDWGGQALPVSLGMAVAEMWNSASMAFGLVPLLTGGAIEALSAHGSTELKSLYLPKLVSGEWTGTMNLTEPQAGSDVGALATRAERAADGSYRLFGQKIYITYGEHDLAENIVHLVLARLADAPQGSKGVSLFLVPKFLPDAQGRPGRRNDVICAGIERKLGIHASPTCTMLYGSGAGETGDPGAAGWLVGEENRGLACMFTMMNSARLAVGIQGVAVAEAATQKALAYARERRQGSAPGVAGTAPIIHHRDIQRGLLTMQALTAAARAVCYACADAIDRSRSGGADAARWSARADLLTPIAKAFATDTGVAVASLGIQVHGGMGYVEETGAAVFLRDARIAPIYEGTNGIQAIDLVLRKLPLDDGRHVEALLQEFEGLLGEIRASGRPGLVEAAAELLAALDHCRAAVSFLKGADRETALCGATPFLRLLALMLGGALLARQALASGSDGETALFRFFARNILCETAGLAPQVTNGADSLAEAAGLVLFA